MELASLDSIVVVNCLGAVVTPGIVDLVFLTMVNRKEGAKKSSGTIGFI
jgi:hypothetical protein